LQVFHLDVAYICNGFQVFLDILASVSYACLNVSSVFFCMLQLLHLNVLKVDQVLHMGCAWEAAGGAGNVRGNTSQLLRRSLASPTR
jgi:hypothetical protein